LAACSCALSLDFSNFHAFQRPYLQAQVLFYEGKSDSLPLWLVAFFEQKTSTFLTRNIHLLPTPPEAPEHHKAYTILCKMNEISERIFKELQSQPSCQIEYRTTKSSHDNYLFRYPELIQILVTPKIQETHPDIQVQVQTTPLVLGTTYTTVTATQNS